MWKMVASAVVISTVISACKKEIVQEVYVSSTGFQPYIYLKQGNITYTMLDVFPQEGDLLTYISRQVVVPSENTPDGAINFSRVSVNCNNWTYKVLGQGETISRMHEDRPDIDYGKLVDGSSKTRASVFACKSAKKIS